MATNKSLVGRCGLYCGACCIYRAERDDPAMRARLAEQFNCPPEKVACRGCGALTPECWGYECKFLVCMRERGCQYCFECPDYDAGTCEKFEKFADQYLKEDNVDLRANLTMIKSGRIDVWLADSDRRYSCRHCRKPTVTGAKKCHHCDREL